MALVEFELKDRWGTDTEIGDEIIVEDVPGFGNYIDATKINPTIRAKIMFTPSKGLHLKILEIIDYGDGCDLQIGKRLYFPRTVWWWKNITRGRNKKEKIDG